MVPSSGRCMPYRVFISVDLPAPFSPTTACTVPRITTRLTSRLATTPGKVLVMPRSSTAGGADGRGRGGWDRRAHGQLLTDAGASGQSAGPGSHAIARSRARWWISGHSIHQDEGTVMVPSSICVAYSSVLAV